MQRSADLAIPLGVSEKIDRPYVLRLVALFCAGWTVIFADRTVPYPLLTVIAREFKLSGVETGPITGAYFTLYVSAQPTSGLLAERLGLKRRLVLFSAVSALGVAGFGLAAVNYVALLVVAGPHGAGARAYYTMVHSISIHSVPNAYCGIAWLGDYLSRTHPEAVGTAVALFSFTGVSSAVVGPPLTGWIKDLTGSLAGGFYLAAALALVGFFLPLSPADSGRRGANP